MNNGEWAAEIKSCFVSTTSKKGPSGVTLPGSSQIGIDGNRECVVIKMTDDGLSANMQTDKAAFEGWALALRRWCGVEEIVLKWESPQNVHSGRHYQRFLYRVRRFQELFPTWFKVPELKRECLRSARAFGPGPLILNVPGKRRSPDPTNTSTTEREQVNAERGLLREAAPEPSEAELEKKLYSSTTFKGFFKLDRVDRQRPVGLFNEKVANGHRVFTGGNSAIDLIGIGDRTIYVFELKKHDNVSIGAISELFFYASVLRDAAGSGAPFQFHEVKSAPGTTVGSPDIVNCERIKAVLLHEIGVLPRHDIHPLLDKTLFFTLNEAATQKSYALLGRVPVRFSCIRFCGTDKDFTFENR